MSTKGFYAWIERRSAILRAREEFAARMWPLLAPRLDRWVEERRTPDPITGEPVFEADSEMFELRYPSTNKSFGSYVITAAHGQMIRFAVTTDAPVISVQIDAFAPPFTSNELESSVFEYRSANLLEDDDVQFGDPRNSSAEGTLLGYLRWFEKHVLDRYNLYELPGV